MPYSPQELLAGRQQAAQQADNNELMKVASAMMSYGDELAICKIAAMEQEAKEEREEEEKEERGEHPKLSDEEKKEASAMGMFAFESYINKMAEAADLIYGDPTVYIRKLAQERGAYEKVAASLGAVRRSSARVGSLAKNRMQQHAAEVAPGMVGTAVNTVTDAARTGANTIANTARSGWNSAVRKMEDVGHAWGRTGNLPSGLVGGGVGALGGAGIGAATADDSGTGALIGAGLGAMGGAGAGIGGRYLAEHLTRGVGTARAREQILASRARGTELYDKAQRHAANKAKAGK